MQWSRLLICLAIMAGVTYLCRVVTMVLFRKKIKNEWVQSFLFYVPYGVLSAMVFPAVIFCTGNWVSALVGTAVALILAFCKRGLFVVSLSSVAAVLVTELLFLL